ncbi:cellulose-binding protein [Streptomyces sp. NPDC091377]|uniref:cellulose-binding protein n=1 Tax=unclassified Streptomyces TaxID=2593676 RepID=UPI0037F31E40
MTVRGRGYRPDQVEAFTAALSLDRDAAWERAARLTVLAKDMGAEAARLREILDTLPEQTYEALGERAQGVLRLAEEEAADVRHRARRDGEAWVAEAEAYGRRVGGQAREEADALRAEVEERARQLLLAAQAEADDLRIGARREIKESRGEALSALREVRQRTEGLLAEQEREHAERWALVERETMESATWYDSGGVDRMARAEADLADAERALAAEEESARRLQEEAGVRAGELIAEARRNADQIARETERVLCEHGERWDDVRAQMDRVRSSLAALTGGRATAE